MYCKYCGRQIEENSLYCKYCGGNLNESKMVQNVTIPKSKLLERFKSFSLKVQILIITYIIYLLIWICCLIGAYDIETTFISFIVFGFIIPFALVCGYYFWKRHKENKSMSIKEKISVSNTPKVTNIKTEPNIKSSNIPLYVKKKRVIFHAKHLKGRNHYWPLQNPMERCS